MARGALQRDQGPGCRTVARAPSAGRSAFGPARSPVLPQPRRAPRLAHGRGVGVLRGGAGRSAPAPHARARILAPGGQTGKCPESEGDPAAVGFRAVSPRASRRPWRPRIPQISGAAALSRFRPGREGRSRNRPPPRLAPASPRAAARRGIFRRTASLMAPAFALRFRSGQAAGVPPERARSLARPAPDTLSGGLRPTTASACGLRFGSLAAAIPARSGHT